MTNKQEYSTEIKKQFGELKTKTDLLNILNLAKKDLCCDDKAELFTWRQLNYHRYNSLNPKRYESFSVKKKSGGVRVITAPNAGLKAIQKCLNHIFQLCYKPDSHAFGFVSDKSVVDNAKVHIGQNYIYNIDLKDFFPSIESGRIYKRLMSKPFNLNSELASFITDLCCHTMEVERKNEQGAFEKVVRTVLPQGAPTSPMLTNIICEKLDRKLSRLAQNHNLKYSRYADDITFSGMHNAFDNNSSFVSKMQEIIVKEGFTINDKKTRLQKHCVRQEVTGLIVSQDRVNVTKRYIKELRGILHCWEKYGYDDVVKRFTPRYAAEKGHVKKRNPLINVVRGKLLYLKMVKGLESKMYQTLKGRFDKLVSEPDRKFLNDVIDIWETNGIEAAMLYYYKNVSRTQHHESKRNDRHEKDNIGGADGYLPISSDELNAIIDNL